MRDHAADQRWIAQKLEFGFLACQARHLGFQRRPLRIREGRRAADFRRDESQILIQQLFESVHNGRKFMRAAMIDHYVHEIANLIQRAHRFQQSPHDGALAGWRYRRRTQRVLQNLRAMNERLHCAKLRKHLGWIDFRAGRGDDFYQRARISCCYDRKHV